MIILKWILLVMILILTSYIGLMISGRYKKRVRELKEMKNGLHIFETKIRYTCEPLRDIFLEIAKNAGENIGDIFKNAANNMQRENATDSWTSSIQNAKTNMNKEDLEVLKGLGKLLGKTDLEGQIGQIQLTSTFLENQIEKAEKDFMKNEKLYKTLRCCFRPCLRHYFNLNLAQKKQRRRHGY